MSGEFGDNVSISSRRKSVAIADDGNVMTYILFLITYSITSFYDDFYAFLIK